MGFAPLKVPVPEKLQKMPKWNGWIIPFITMLDKDGNPDFKVVDETKRIECIMKRLCGICGQSFPYQQYVFIGSDECAKSRVFFDPPAHKECAYYATKVCPYLANTRREYAEQMSKIEKNPSPEIQGMVKFIQPRPKRMIVYVTRGYNLHVQKERGMQLLLVKADKPVEIDWHAMPITDGS